MERTTSHTSPPSRWSALPTRAAGCCTYRLQIRKEQTGIVNAILESYEWVCRVRTEHIEKGILEITVMPDWDSDFQEACGRLARRIPMSFLTWKRDALKEIEPVHG